MREEFEIEASKKELQFTVQNYPCWVRSDSALLARMLRNLVSNDVKYTPSGGQVSGVPSETGADQAGGKGHGPGHSPGNARRDFRGVPPNREPGMRRPQGFGPWALHCPENGAVARPSDHASIVAVRGFYVHDRRP